MCRCICLSPSILTLSLAVSSVPAWAHYKLSRGRLWTESNNLWATLARCEQWIFNYLLIICSSLIEKLKATRQLHTHTHYACMTSLWIQAVIQKKSWIRSVILNATGSTIWVLLERELKENADKLQGKTSKQIKY